MGAAQAMLVCRVGGRVCALRLQQVREVMRPLPTEPLAGAPGFVVGLAVIRGRPTPVVDAARLLGVSDAPPATRFVTLALTEGQPPRAAALAVSGVVGLRQVDARQLERAPPLLGELAQAAVEALGTLDAQLLLVLRAARLVPDL